MEGFKVVFTGLLIFSAFQSTLVACSRLHLLQAPSGPNPGGNSFTQTTPKLVADSGPSPGGNKKIDGSLIKAEMAPRKLDEAPSGPNPGGNAFLLGDAKVVALTNKLPKNTPTPNPGPSPVHNSVSKVVATPERKTAAVEKVEQPQLDNKLTKSATPNPGPSPIRNSDSKVVKLPASRLVAGRVNLRSKMPNNPTPNPGPSPVHNSVSRIINVEKRSGTGTEIGCADKMDPNLFTASSAMIFSHN